MRNLAKLLTLAVVAGASLAKELNAAETATGEASFDWARERQFWSFQVPKKSPLPEVRDIRWPRQRMDSFVLARLEAHGIVPSEPADRAVWLRRVTFDLTGLPPTPAEIDAFALDREHGAEARVVDRLLGSPRFGERWASLWLPLARYAEDQAHQVGDDTKYFYPNAWKYRAWVIAAFNQDMAYDQFVQRQIAADLIDGTNSMHRAALGFLGLGPKYYNRDRIDVMADEWEDRVDTVTRAMLGLTVACARCHDHKFEPITMRDYYALAGVFASTRMVNVKPDGGSEDDKADAKKMDAGTLHVVAEGEVKPVHIFLRGQPERLGPLVERSFPRVLTASTNDVFRRGSGRLELAQAIGRADNPLVARVWVNRVWGAMFGKPLVLTPSNFGHSGTPPGDPKLLDDLAACFVEQGWSTKRFIRELALSATYRQRSDTSAPKRCGEPRAPGSAKSDPWPPGSSIQVASIGHAFESLAAGTHDSNAATVDPGNEWLWRMNRRRLTVEQWRDAALWVSGSLDLRGGKSLELLDPTNRLRTVFARVSRLQLHDMLLTFDYPDANVHAEKRAETVTPLQKLFLLNSPFLDERARNLASRMEQEFDEDTRLEDRIRGCYAYLFGRIPDDEELELGRDFLTKPPSGAMTRWELYAHLLLASNEMWYLD